MRAMLFESSPAQREAALETHTPGANQLLIRVRARGVRRTGCVRLP